MFTFTKRTWYTEHDWQIIVDWFNARCGNLGQSLGVGAKLAIMVFNKSRKRSLITLTVYNYVSNITAGRFRSPTPLPWHFCFLKSLRFLVQTLQILHFRFGQITPSIDIDKRDDGPFCYSQALYLNRSASFQFKFHWKLRIRPKTSKSRVTIMSSNGHIFAMELNSALFVQLSNAFRQFLSPTNTLIQMLSHTLFTKVTFCS